MQVQVLESTGPGDSEDLVMLHGWATDSRIWQAVMPALQERFRIHLVDLPGFANNAELLLGYREADWLVLANAGLPDRFHMIGWSLGGNLALSFAAAFPQRVLTLTLLCCNPVFVAKDHAGMDKKVFDDFYETVRADASAGVKQFLRLMAQGDPQEKHLKRQLRSVFDEPLRYNTKLLLAALEYLGSTSQQALVSPLGDKCLMLFGEYDALVPVGIADHYPFTRVMSGVGHTPMLTAPEVLVSQLFEHLDNPPLIDKQKVARSFSAAASSYDGMAKLQRDVGEKLVQMLPETESVESILDLGCGTGFMLPELQRQHPQAELVACDIAEGMLRYVQSAGRVEKLQLVAMDAEALSLAPNSVDIIYSNLALQWCFDLPALFEGFKQALRPGGCVVFSTLLEDTLGELKASWREVDNLVHVNRFLSSAQWQRGYTEAGFSELNWELEDRVMEYDSLAELSRELKGIGAHNVNEGSPRGLMGKRRWQGLLEAYERWRRADGKLPATYKVAYGVLKHA